MTEILVLVDDATDAAPLRHFAGALATALHARLVEAAMPPYGPDCGRQVLAEVDAPSIDFAVLPYASGRRARLVQELISRSSTPIVLVPMGTGAVAPTQLCRVLVPLDGTVASAKTVTEVVALFGAGGAEIVVLHVFDGTTVPRMWDQPAHAGQDWADEFLARYCDLPYARIELRSGLPGERVVDVAREEHVDLIAVGWSQHLAPGRARTVRAILSHSGVPMLLLPVSDNDAGDEVPPTAIASSVRP